MAIDIRSEASRYYDLNPEFPDDIPFYKKRIPSAAARVLELGCGTGRVLIPLASACGYIHGIDLSQAMISRCKEKLRRARIAASKAQVDVGDITKFNLVKTSI
jgi:ubiquinone/menaquinone biosynthesis C-methylase UbiE